MIKTIVGLGNPGDKYALTRHNAGFLFVDTIAYLKNLPWTFDKKFNAFLTTFESYLLVKPQTYMNDSGKCVASVLSYFKGTPHDLLLVHDDADLESLTYKLVYARGAAGHHGVENVMEALNTREFHRLRIGVGRPSLQSYSIEKYVLKALSQDEIAFVKALAEGFSNLY